MQKLNHFFQIFHRIVRCNPLQTLSNTIAAIQLCVGNQMYSEMDVTLTLTCGVLHLSCYPANPLHSQLIVALLLLAANCQVNVREKAPY